MTMQKRGSLPKISIRVKVPDADREAMRLMRNLRAGKRASVSFPYKPQRKKQAK